MEAPDGRDDGDLGRGVRIDDREHELFASMQRDYPNVKCTRIRLATGDVHIMHGNLTAFVLERKSRADLRASLIDGRFRTQRSRMVEEYGSANIGFVIEGGTCWAESESGAEIALVMRDRVPVMWSANVDDTAALIARLVGADITPRSVPPSGENATRAAVAAPNCPAKSLAAMLRCVPGVSARRAGVLSSKFGSMLALIAAIQHDRVGTMADISKCRGTNGGNVFGASLASKIVACMGTPSAAPPS